MPVHVHQLNCAAWSIEGLHGIEKKLQLAGATNRSNIGDGRNHWERHYLAQHLRTKSQTRDITRANTKPQTIIATKFDYPDAGIKEPVIIIVGMLPVIIINSSSLSSPC